MNNFVILGLLLIYACSVINGCNIVIPLYRYNLGGDYMYTTQVANGDLQHTYYIYSRDNPPSGSVPLYEYYNGKHFYTTNSAEIGTVVMGVKGKDDFECLGIVGYCFPAQMPGTIPLYRIYNKRVKDHAYTTNAIEVAAATKVYGYTDEGIACYIPAGAQ